jgi:sugar/nucleoside kinase (ribokinase family)
VTRSEKGALVVTREETQSVNAFPIENLVDTTGAGDLFAAGFLVGLSREQTLADCARLGALAAAEVIQHYGARPQADLKALATENGLL